MLFVFIDKDDSEGDNGQIENSYKFADEKVIQTFVIVFPHVCRINWLSISQSLYLLLRDITQAGV